MRSERKCIPAEMLSNWSRSAVIVPYEDVFVPCHRSWLAVCMDQAYAADVSFRCPVAVMFSWL